MSEQKKTDNVKVKKNRVFRAWLVICAIVFICGTFINAHDSYPQPELEKMKTAVKAGREKGPENIPGIVLLKTDKNNNVTNMSLLLFTNEQNIGYITIKGLRKTRIFELCDTKHPKKMYAAVKRFTSYDVDKYIMYNDKTILGLLKIGRGIHMNLQIDRKHDVDDVKAVNKDAPQYAKKYHLKKDPKLIEDGYQPLGTSQSLAFANLYYQDYYYYGEELQSFLNDWRNMQIIYPLMIIMHQQSFEDLEKSWAVISKGDHSINDKDLLKLCAAVKNYRVRILNAKSMINK